VVLHSLYVRILSIKLISSLNWEVSPIAKLSAPIGHYTKPYMSQIGNKHG